MTPSALDPLVGLWVAVLVALVALASPLLRELLRRTEDPRPVAAFRVLVGVWLLAWLVDLAPLRMYLLSSQGLEPAAEASGVPDTPGEVVRSLLDGRLTPLSWADSPTVVDAVFVLLGISALCFTLGLFTRVTKWTTLLLFHTILARSTIHLAGEPIYAAYLLLLGLSDCGAAYGVDAWRARRKDPAAPSPRIPGWPRLLMVLQTVPILFHNGLAKSGEAWWRGDTVYFLLTNPRFAVLDPASWRSPAMIEVLRRLTWGVHLIELLFPLAALGFVVSRARGLRAPPRRRLIGGLVATLGILSFMVARAAWSDRELWWTLPGRVIIGYALGLVVVGILVARGRPLPPRVAGLVGRWLLGWRSWVPLVAGFMGGIVLLADVGWFPAVTLSSAVLLIDRGPVDGDPAIEPSADPPPRLRGWARARWPVITSFCAVHVLAVTWANMPRARERAAWRRGLDEASRHWLALARTRQSWRMFSPGAPVRVRHHETWLVHADGTRERLFDDVPTMHTSPKSRGRSKAWKISLRLLEQQDSRSRHLRYVCRTHGRAGDTVELFERSFVVPPPGADARERPEIVRPLGELTCPSREPS